MSEFPFQLSIKAAYPNNATEALTCKAVLRNIPGRRQVYDADWDGRDVIVKLFSHSRHAKREWKGLTELQNLELNSPEPLFYGKTDEGLEAIVTERIADSKELWDMFQNTSDRSERFNLLVLLCGELAIHHQKGVLQKDLHLGNFLLADGKIFSLDPAQMSFTSTQLSKNKSISQLASLACCLDENDTKSIRQLCSRYFEHRNWHFEKSDETLLFDQMARHRKAGIKRALKKTLRTSKRYLKVKAGNYLAVFARSFCQGAEPLEFIKQIDALMNKGQVLKNGRTCYVSRLSWNRRDVVVKRYNHKNFFHSLRHTIKGSRAPKSWLDGHCLEMLGILTPKPMAYIEIRKGPIIWTSYIVTEFVQGQNFYNFLRDQNIDQRQKAEVKEQILELIDKLNRHKISHGDLKYSNILITDLAPALTDLDSMRVFPWQWLFKICEKNDFAQPKLTDTVK